MNSDLDATMTDGEARYELLQAAPRNLLLDFANALQEADAFGGEIGNVLDFLEKPWKCAAEYAAWVDNGKPLDDSEPGWAEFLVAVQA